MLPDVRVMALTGATAPFTVPEDNDHCFEGFEVVRVIHRVLFTIGMRPALVCQSSRPMTTVWDLALQLTRTAERHEADAK
jgi:hypothetical protein